MGESLHGFCSVCFALHVLLCANRCATSRYPPPKKIYSFAMTNTPKYGNSLNLSHAPPSAPTKAFIPSHAAVPSAGSITVLRSRVPFMPPSLAQRSYMLFSRWNLSNVTFTGCVPASKCIATPPAMSLVGHTVTSPTSGFGPAASFAAAGSLVGSSFVVNLGFGP